MVDSNTSGLTGHLEDLPLLDMLQIVAFSRKTGYLKVEGPPGKGGVVFKEGLVVCAYSWSTLKFLRKIGDDPQGAHTIAVLQKQIEISLQELAGLHEGKFHFQVTDAIPAELDGLVIAPFILHQGINPEALLLDLAREMDEGRRETSDMLESGSLEIEPPSHDPSEGPQTLRIAEPITAAQPEPASSALPEDQEEEERSILLVDDEPLVRQTVGIALREAGYRVYTAPSPSEGFGLASEIVLSGERLLVVTDLGMPSSSGRSFRGGFELIRALKRNEVEAPILLMAEKLSHKARERAREMGVHKVALKPALSKLDPEQYEKDLQAFATGLLPILQGLHASSPVEEDESLPAMGEDKTSAPFLDFITSMTEQLLNPRRSTDVSDLVIEIASKYLERGILFLIKGEMACGISGFGLVSTEAANREVARGIRFNTQQARPFAEVAYSGKGARFSAELDCLQPSLYAAIGRGRASECLLMPMLNNGEVLVILYGDNATSGRRIGTLRGLELFMGQAGMALENTFLHQKLRLFENKLARDSRKELAEVQSEST